MLYIVTKFGADWFIFVDAIKYTKSNAAIFPNSRANNSRCSAPIGPMIKLLKILLDINFCPSLVLTGLYLQMIECKQSQI